MNCSKEDVLRLLSTVPDPDLGKDLVSLGMIKDVVVQSNKVSFTVVLTTPACPLKEKIKQDCIAALKTEISQDTQYEINMTSSVTSKRGEGDILKGVKNVIAIASGKGGVGKSTITANLAVSLANKGASVGILDADIYGPSIPIMFGCDEERPSIESINNKKFIIPLERYHVKLTSIGILTPADSPIIWRGPMASATLKQLINDVHWGNLDYLFIDLPPGTGDIHLTLTQTIPMMGVVVVTTPQKVALADAAKGLAMFKQPQINVPVFGVIENMAYFIPEDAPDKKYYIFGKGGALRLAHHYQTSLLGQVPLVQTVRESGDYGSPSVLQKENPTTVIFEKIAESVAQCVAVQNAKIVDATT